MKNWKYFSFMAIVAIIALAFVFTACKDDDGDEEDGGSGGAVSGISSLVLSGQVYGEDYSQFKGNLNISGVYNWYGDVVNIGTGRITNGVLNYTIGTPPNSSLTSYKDLEDGYLFSPNETTSNGNVKIFGFSSLKTDSDEFDYLFKANMNSESGAFYIYVDGDVTISSVKTEEINAFSLSLKKGWNIGNYSNRSGLTITLGNTSNKWVLVGYYGDSGTLAFELINNGAAYSVGNEQWVSGNVVIPASYNGKPVTEIGSRAFRRCDGLTSITIPSSVTSMGNYAFENCRNLRSVTFAAGSAIISDNFGSNAFPEGSGNGGNTLKTAYLAGGAGTYTRAAYGEVWTKR